MTETASNVYDLIYPSPATLKEISCNALITGLWRWEVENRTNDDYDEFISELNLCKNLDPRIPSTLKIMIDVHIGKFITSMGQWSGYHCVKLLHFPRNDENCTLHDFYDFACERDGTIHYIRTAGRMMTSDLFSNEEKFKIACMYSFEDDIRRIWPSVWKKFDLNEIDFDRSPQLFYWICMLRNKLDQIPNPDDDPIDAVMLRVSPCPSYHWSSLVYFWNRICPENQLVEAINVYKVDEESFVRFILPKFSDELLDKFVAAEGSYLIYDLLTSRYDKFCVLPTWMYFRNKMKENNFIDLIELFMLGEINHFAKNVLNENLVETEDESFLCCEIWRTSPGKLKQSAIKYILTQDDLFPKEPSIPPRFRETRFLSTVLLDSSRKERNTFWHTNWRCLINGTRGKDLQRIMELCFKNEQDIVKFKETVIPEDEYASIGVYCRPLLKHGYFEEIDDLLIFCCPEIQKRKNLKQHFLRLVFLDDDFSFTLRHFLEVESMNEFINDAFEDVELATDFKNNCVLSCTDKYFLHQRTVGVRSTFSWFSADYLVHFIDTLVQTEKHTVFFKQRILNYVRDFLINGNILHASADDLETILLWCLGNEDEITNFKQSLPSSDLFHQARRELNLFTLKTENPEVEEFLEWYFGSPEEIEAFQREYSKI
ncbi:uncharacterized protein LOC135834500 isoform X20 [Planococcus citri]|uniref:uncharacterized protein LOC135834500 isoform X20 n=1 Tax=Planococcus citri TaxID=170843 RepID=UPI0031F97992